MKILIILLIVTVQAQAQYKINLSLHKTSLAFTVLQGLTDGFRDASIFGRMRDNGQWFNGIDSWKNKYKNGDPAQGAKFPLSTTAFVFVTDANHAVNMLSNLSGECAKVTMPNMEGATNWQKIKTVILYSVVRSAGHNLVYGILYKGKNFRP